MIKYTYSWKWNYLYLSNSYITKDFIKFLYKKNLFFCKRYEKSYNIISWIILNIGIQHFKFANLFIINKSIE